MGYDPVQHFSAPLRRQQPHIIGSLYCNDMKHGHESAV
jgi:hypothetical protein